MSIRIGALTFPVKSAQLYYTRVPNGTIQVFVEIVGKDLEGQPGPHLTLDPPPIPGRALSDLSGQVLGTLSPTKPDRYDSGSINVVAGIYVYAHESVYDSRIEWGPTAEDGGVSMRWTGTIEDLDQYDGTMPRLPLEVAAHALVTERPHERVSWTVSRAGTDEFPVLEGIQSSVVARLHSDLTAARWFEGLPFPSVELVLQVEAAGRRWPGLPPPAPGDRQLIIASVPRALVLSGDEMALRRAIEAEVVRGLDALAKRHRQRSPKLLL